nr:MAG: hypothetical protein DiTV3a_F2ORF5 [Diabrotica toursvirus 3a]
MTYNYYYEIIDLVSEYLNLSDAYNVIISFSLDPYYVKKNRGITLEEIINAKKSIINTSLNNYFTDRYLMKKTVNDQLFDVISDNENYIRIINIYKSKQEKIKPFYLVKYGVLTQNTPIFRKVINLKHINSVINFTDPYDKVIILINFYELDDLRIKNCFGYSTEKVRQILKNLSLEDEIKFYKNFPCFEFFCNYYLFKQKLVNLREIDKLNLFLRIPEVADKIFNFHDLVERNVSLDEIKITSDEHFNEMFFMNTLSRIIKKFPEFRCKLSDRIKERLYQ